MKVSEIAQGHKDYISLLTQGGSRPKWESYFTLRVNKTRNPASYAPKAYTRIGPISVLRVNAYSAISSERGYIYLCRETIGKPGSFHAQFNPTRSYRDVEISPQIPIWVLTALSQGKTQANVEFLNKINTRKVSMLEELRNGKESIQTIATSVLRLHRMMRRAIREPKRFVKTSRKIGKLNGIRLTAQRQLKTISDVWLEGRYHWLPTYMTMRDAFIALRDQHLIGTVYHKHKTPSYEWTQTYDAGGYGSVEVTFSVRREYARGCLYTPQSDLESVLRRYGVGSIPDLTAVAWELIPGSLLVDWVLPVSDTLLALGALRGVKTHNDWQTEKTFISLSSARVLPKSQEKNSDATINYFEVSHKNNRRCDYEEYKRTTLSSSELPVQPYLSMAPVTWLRALDALSFFSGSKMGQKVISGRT